VLDQEVLLEDRDLVALAVLGDRHQLVGDARRHGHRLAATSPFATGARPRRADPAAGAAGGHLLLDGLGPARPGRPSRRRLGLRGGGAVGVGLRPTPTAPRGPGGCGRVRVGLRLVPLGLDRILDLGLAFGLRCPAAGGLLAASPTAAAAPPLLRRGRGGWFVGVGGIG
jgi:hypothetical protein